MIRKILDWAGYAGVAVLAAGVVLPYARPDLAHYRGFLYAGALLVLASLLARIEDYRAFFGARTTRYGLNAAVMILLVLGVTTIVQALSYQHSWRWDLTETKRFSLSPQTVQLLSGLKTDVSAVAFFRTDQPGKRLAEDLLKQYARYANGRFTWRVLDPDRDPALAKRYAIETYGTTVLEAGAKSEKVLDADEEKLTNALVKVTRAGKRVVYAVQGHGEPEVANTDRGGFSEAKTALERTNYEVKPLVLVREGKVPADAAVVIVAGPRTDLLKPELKGKIASHDPRQAGGGRGLATYLLEVLGPEGTLAVPTMPLESLAPIPPVAVNFAGEGDEEGYAGEHSGAPDVGGEPDSSKLSASDDFNYLEAVTGLKLASGKLGRRDSLSIVFDDDAKTVQGVAPMHVFGALPIDCRPRRGE